MEPFPNRPLVSVEWQTERNLETGAAQRRMFVKMYFDARDSGLLADIPDDLWKTLCLLATYVNEDGFCFPSQDTVARALGIGRQAANRRIRRLREYRFEGRPVLSVNRERVRSAKGPTRWGRNVYQLHPIAAFAFGDSQQRDATRYSSMSPQRDIESSMSLSMSAPADIASSRDMNKSQVLNKNTHRVSEGEGNEAQALVARFHARLGRERRRPSAKELRQAVELLSAHGPDAGRFVVDFAVASARRTGFEMRHFGAVACYLDEAVAEHGRQVRKRIGEEHVRRAASEAELRERYERWRAAKVSVLHASMDKNALAELERGALTRVLARTQGKRPPGFQTLLRIELMRDIAVLHGVGDFDMWQASLPRVPLREVG